MTYFLTGEEDSGAAGRMCSEYEWRKGHGNGRRQVALYYRTSDSLLALRLNISPAKVFRPLYLCATYNAKRAHDARLSGRLYSHQVL
jgi:hypothetical protein